MFASQRSFTIFPVNPQFSKISTIKSKEDRIENQDNKTFTEIESNILPSSHFGKLIKNLKIHGRQRR